MRVTRRTLFQALCALPLIRLIPLKVEAPRPVDVTTAEITRYDSASTMCFTCHQHYAVGTLITYQDYFTGRIIEVSTDGNGLYTIKAVDCLSLERAKKRYGRTRG